MYCSYICPSPWLRDDYADNGRSDHIQDVNFTKTMEFFKKISQQNEMGRNKSEKLHVF